MMATSSISAMRMPRSHPSYRARVSPSRASPASNRMRVAATASSKKVLVPIGEGSEDMETSIMVDVLRRAGADVTVASVEAQLECVMARQMKFVADCLIADCANETYDLVALPGGMPGAERLRDCATLTAIVKKQAAAKLPYAAMCASPAVVLSAQGLLDGVAATAHPAFSDQLQGDSVEGRVVVDGNVITSRGPGTAIEFSLAMVEMLYGEAKAKEVAAPMVMPPTVRAALVPNEWTLEKVQQPELSVDGAATVLYVDTVDASDPMERFCADAPDADECRVYDD